MKKRLKGIPRRFKRKPVVVHSRDRLSLPVDRNGKTIKVVIKGKNVYLTTGEYEDGTLGEIFIKIGKQGEENAVYDMAAIAISLGLQYGVPLEVFVNKLEHQRMESGGVTSDPDLPIVSSIMDWIAKRLRKDFLSADNLDKRPNSPS